MCHRAAPIQARAELKSDHFGIEIEARLRNDYDFNLLKSDHFGIEI